jgi:hypothetical protein
MNARELPEVHIGGYRVSSDAQRQLQRVREEQ